MQSKFQVRPRSIYIGVFREAFAQRTTPVAHDSDVVTNPDNPLSVHNNDAHMWRVVTWPVRLRQHIVDDIDTATFE